LIQMVPEKGIEPSTFSLRMTANRHLSVFVCVDKLASSSSYS
jgi:hypothetical protein